MNFTFNILNYFELELRLITLFSKIQFSTKLIFRQRKKTFHFRFASFRIYTIVASQNIRSNSNYNVSISVFNQTEPVAMRVAIRSKEAKYRNAQNITIFPNTTQTVTLQLGELNTYAKHRLFVEAFSGLKCAHNASLVIERKNVSIFVQTDKAIYKPEEVIRFRVLVLDSKLRSVQLSANSTSFLIYVEDAENNRIKQWKNGNLSKGVFASQFKLSKLPVLGNWKIVVEIDEEVIDSSDIMAIKN